MFPFAAEPNFFLKTGLVSLISLASLCIAGSSLAATLNNAFTSGNGGFENSDFTGWETFGRTTIETDAFGSGPTEGTYQARLDTVCPNADISPGDRCPNTGGNFTDLAMFLDVSPMDLNDLEPNSRQGFEGSAIKTTFSVRAGDQISFDWNFLSDNKEIPMFNDFSFVTLSQTAPSRLGSTFSTLLSSDTNFSFETGFREFSFTFDEDGEYTLGIGVTDVGDGAFDSGLLVDNVALFRKPMMGPPGGPQPPTRVPEPASVLSLLALGAWGFIRKQSSQR
jgi:hypothetical protein